MSLPEDFPKKLEQIELSRIKTLTSHPVLVRIKQGEMLFEDLSSLLLQRRFVSHAITNLYDYAIDSDINDECKNTLRAILREEYPGYPTPLSHREELIKDLNMIGIPLITILKSRPSPATKASIEAMINQILDYSSNLCPVKVIAFTRFVGEVLVAEEYKVLWLSISERLKESGFFPEEDSRFYGPHIKYDSRYRFTDSIAEVANHSSHLGIDLMSYIASENDIALFKEAEDAALNIKISFYDQFLGCVESPL
jgi:hypothetical protein